MRISPVSRLCLTHADRQPLPTGQAVRAEPGNSCASGQKAHHFRPATIHNGRALVGCPSLTCLEYGRIRAVSGGFAVGWHL